MGGRELGEKAEKAVCDAIESFSFVFHSSSNLHHDGNQKIPFFGQKEWQDERKG